MITTTDHVTTWIEFSTFWSSPLVIHTLGHRRVVGYCAADPEDTDDCISWEPALQTTPGGSWWGGELSFATEEAALEWLYSQRGTERGA